MLKPNFINSSSLMLILAISASAQSTSFTPGNLVVSRSVYAGDSNTVVAGQALPPVCPSTATCNNKATDSGAYPSSVSASNVWNNDKIDGSFGITSPIFLDQVNPATGATLSTLPVPANMLVTSFASKS